MWWDKRNKFLKNIDLDSVLWFWLCLFVTNHPKMNGQPKLTPKCVNCFVRHSMVFFSTFHVFNRCTPRITDEWIVTINICHSNASAEDHRDNVRHKTHFLLFTYQMHFGCLVKFKYGGLSILAVNGFDYRTHFLKKVLIDCWRCIWTIPSIIIVSNYHYDTKKQQQPKLKGNWSQNIKQTEQPFD